MNKRFLTALLTGAFFIASASMFVSCKDYDDDIHRNTAAIEKLQSELNQLESNLKAELEQTKATLNTVIQNQSADEAEITRLASRVYALEAEIQTIKDTYAKKSDLEALATTVATLTGRVDELTRLLGEETAARQAADDTLNNRINAEQTARQNADTAFTNQINAINQRLNAAGI